MHLMQILDVKNVVVVVTRWYGGIQLGADRFKHINNAARQVLEENGYLPEDDAKKASGGKKGEANKRKKGKSDKSNVLIGQVQGPNSLGWARVDRAQARPNRTF
ncbi:hypothetical protein BC937DRAFT_92927 [Endogone sp. FLAS-F59071]|nr:hypothetical protein BC937DRAFT_92927 [Endogone sp. FLAS-F59071]|eukprot:RUS21360.1 hypothetical protein BC937DRAFT_92927 [Endogone sp. FLAS-F59071]